MQIKVIEHRDEDKFPRSIEIWKGNKKLTVEQTPSPSGDTVTMVFKGRRDVLPSYSEIIKIVDARRIDRIGTIELINLLEKIELIDEITKIVTVDEITNVKLIDLITKISEITEVKTLSAIREVTSPESGLILNPSFEQDFTGWYSTGQVKIDTAISHVAGKSAKFAETAGTGQITQKFPTALDPSWWSELYFWLRAGSTLRGLTFKYYYTDGNSSEESFLPTLADTWEKKTCSPTAGKKIERLWIYNSGTGAWVPSYLDDITVVF